MRRLVVAALASAVALLPAVTAAAAPSTAVPSAGQPARQGGAGWKLAYSADFSGTSLPGRTFTYGSAYSIGASHWHSDYVKVSGGLLRILMDRKPLNGKEYTSGGIGFAVEQAYGKYEWSAKVPVGKGIDSYATLWPEGDSDANALLMEALGTPGAEVMAITNGYGSGKSDKRIGGPFTDRFHTYTVEWAPGSMRVLMDGVLRYSSTRAATVTRTLQFAMVTGDNYSGLPDGDTQFPAEFQIDWVRVYSYAPGAADPAPTPTASRPAGPAASASPAASVSAHTSSTVPGTEAAPVPFPTLPDGAIPVAGGRVSPKPAWVWTGLGVLIAVVAAGVARITWRRRRSE